VCPGYERWRDECRSFQVAELWSSKIRVSDKSQSFSWVAFGSNDHVYSRWSNKQYSTHLGGRATNWPQVVTNKQRGVLLNVAVYSMTVFWQIMHHWKLLITRSNNKYRGLSQAQGKTFDLHSRWINECNSKCNSINSSKKNLSRASLSKYLLDEVIKRTKFWAGCQLEHSWHVALAISIHYTHRQILPNVNVEKRESHDRYQCIIYCVRLSASIALILRQKATWISPILPTCDHFHLRTIRSSLHWSKPA